MLDGSYLWQEGIVTKYDTSVPRIAFLGLGAMGSRIAARLLDAGHELTVWNRTAARAEPLVARGATAAQTPADAVADAELVMTMLADPDALAAISAEFVAALREGTTVVDMSTVGPEAVQRLLATLPQSVELVDAPVLGSRGEAESGTLEVFVGGTDEAFARVLPVLEVLGTVHHVGPLGSGAAAKLVANSTLFGVIAVLGEAIALADALGLDREATWEVLATTAIGPQAERRRASVESGDYPPRFPLRLALKDAELVAAAAERSGIDLRVARAARDWLAEAAAADPEADYSAVLARIVRR
jgi:3-hydroxyisobutyrate dehydrogenase